ncbi:adenine phosphoribosyltransferase [Actinoalloteichus hymeniacidonis]|uniref:Adenine phosphoribosyltransferase n=1 Tax=Actinoalloteichus hymeniacidonis TaxID=340345 RepID=A0AAC9HQ47_9PSEU|nr:adenine phosphoribosyltransferase [Actinoalloteichus hymeniacidonis]AOS63278.1 adenine phosphoribosyltransferase [Actinoalloteichus hymeniacidonis]MBB5908683.1 adenine phosphoribosyltransferase [Actinoalloteichus hymeniacidonis]
MLADRIAASLVSIPDFPTPGVLFRDLAGIYADPELFGASVAELSQRFTGRFDAVLAVEARGFVLGAALARHEARPLILARKPGKLPGEVLEESYSLEYGTNTLQIGRQAVFPGTRVLVVDDLLATGGTFAAAARLVSAAGGTVAGMAALVSLAGLGAERTLGGHDVVSLCEVPAAGS